MFIQAVSQESDPQSQIDILPAVIAMVQIVILKHLHWSIGL